MMRNEKKAHLMTWQSEFTWPRGLRLEISDSFTGFNGLTGLVSRGYSNIRMDYLNDDFSLRDSDTEDSVAQKLPSFIAIPTKRDECIGSANKLSEFPG